MKSKKTLIIFFIIALISFACSSKANSKETTETAQPVEDSEIKVEENTEDISEENIIEIDSSMLEKSVQVPEGGFAFRPVKGYQMEISGGAVLMLASGADPDTGPMIQIQGIKSDVPQTTDQLYEQLQNGTDFSLGEPLEISIDGKTAIAVELTNEAEEPAKQGFIVFLMVDDYQQFVLLSGSLATEWAPFETIVKAVISSIEFIEMVPQQASSNLASGNYAYTNRNAIRDLIEHDGVIYAATLGGLVTWKLDTQSIWDLVPTSGMGHISANSIVYCEIPEPRILVGTLQGISIFNPNTGTWEQRELLPADNIVNTSKIDRLYCDQANNRLLIGYSGLGVLDLTSGEFLQYSTQNGLLWNAVYDITVNGSDIWFASGYKGIAKISNNQVTTFSKEDGMPDEVAYALEFSDDGTLWVGANSGLMSYKNGLWQMFGLDSTAQLASISEIEILSEKSLWITTAPLGTGKLCLFNMETKTCDQEYNSPDNNAILALTTTSISEPIFGTSKGISAYLNGDLISLKTTDQLLSNYVDSLAIAPDGMLWVGMDNGIQVLDPASPESEWQIYQQQDQPAMGGNWATSITFAPDGTAWIAVINGRTSKYQQGQWQAFEDIYSYNVVAVDAQNRTWIGDDGKGIIVLDENGNQIMSWTTANGLPGDNVQALLLDGNGRMWIGTNQGLAKYENDSLTTVFTKDSTEIPNIYIRALAMNPNGNLLIGTYTGVSEYNGNSTTTLIDFLKDGYNEARLTNLACNSLGEIWIGTDKGLLHGNPTNGWEMMTTQTGLLTNYISALTIDQFDTVWVGGGGSNFDGGGLLHIVP